MSPLLTRASIGRHRLWSVTKLGVLVLVVGVSISPFVAGIIGFDLLAVRSGSMEPGIPTGSMIVIRETKPSEATNLKPGSVVTFRQPNTAQLVTHRINSIDTAGKSPRYVTKGDANGIVDPWEISASDVVGVPVAQMSNAGFVYVFLSSWPVRAAVVVFAVALAWMPKIKVVEEQDKQQDIAPDVTLTI